MAYPTDTLVGALEKGAASDTALAAPDRTGLSYGGLRDLTQRTVEALNGIGIGRGDRVALVLPNGPEMAAAFLTIACGATTAPLHPAYRAEEFEFYLADLKAKALVILEGMESPARSVAAAQAIPILELTNDSSRKRPSEEGLRRDRWRSPSSFARDHSKDSLDRSQSDLRILPESSLCASM
jgi:oxalate---CoA ligase